MDIPSKLTDELKSAIRHPIVRSIFSRENLYALIVCLMLLAILIMTADKTPQWIYQGF